MPRIARIKSEDGIYHIMVRSISEVDLFKDNEDKCKYMSILRHYQKMYLFKVYAFCLMSNHGHFIIDVNGADISKIMHCINFKYARYFNTKYKRHGHLFQDRFKSKIIKDDRYLYSLSLYIHNNVLDIRSYKKAPEKYRFSSLGTYIGIKKDEFQVLDSEFILAMFSKNSNIAKAEYMKAIFICKEKHKDDVEFKNEKTKYESKRYIIERTISWDKVIRFICNKFNLSLECIQTKNLRKVSNPKALMIVLLRSLCDINYDEICKIIGNTTESRVSKLSNMGLNLIIDDKRYSNIFDEFLCDK